MRRIEIHAGRSGLVAVLAACLAWLPGVRAAEKEDKGLSDPRKVGRVMQRKADYIKFENRGRIQAGPVKILKDNYAGVTIKTKGGEYPIPRNQVYEVYYEGMDYINFIKALKLYEQGSYRQAFNALRNVERSAANRPQKEAILQHVHYYMGECLLKAGDPKEASAYFKRALYDENAAHYFAARLGQVMCQEKVGRLTDAGTRYEGLALSDFPKKEKRAPWADQYIFDAKFGHLRCRINNMIKQDEGGARLEEMLAELEKLKAENKKFVDENTDARFLRVRAGGLKALGRYQELIDLLDKPIRKAVNTGERELLSGMYMDRADAYWGLYGAAKKNDAGEEEVKNLATRARFEYLRVTLTCNVGTEDLARAYYRLGELFLFFEDDDYLRRAKRSLYKARDADVAPYSDRARRQIQEIKKKEAEMIQAEDGEEKKAEDKADGEG